MYKTIRHGENSLQYTILPQNDDFHVEGKLTSAASSRSARGHKSFPINGDNNNKSKVSQKQKRTPQRRSFFAYLGLIFVCTVIVGAILIPFLVSAECLPSPTKWFLKTKAALIRSSGSNTSTNKLLSNSNRYEVSKSKSAATKGVVAAETVDVDTGVSKNVNIINHNGIEKFILKINETEDLEHNLLRTNVTRLKKLMNSTDTQAAMNTKQKELSVTNVENNANFEMLSKAAQQNQEQQQQPHEQQQSRPIVITTISSANELSIMNPTIASIAAQFTQRPKQGIVGLNGNNLPRVPAYANHSLMNQSYAAPVAITASVLPTIITRIIQVPLLKSAAKKPIIPLLLAKTSSQGVLPSNGGEGMTPLAVPALQTHQNEVSSNSGVASIIKHARNSDRSDDGWMLNVHMPYINTSSYFQWTGSKAEDNVLLPALLGFALIGTVLIITICLMTRNKRTIVSAVRKRNRTDIEEQSAEDNATLLTTTNLSDDD